MFVFRTARQPASEHRGLGRSWRPKVQGMFQSDKLLRQSLIILSQLGTFFFFFGYTHKLVFPSALALSKLADTRGKPRISCLPLRLFYFWQ